jgi:hypothetical protein
MRLVALIFFLLIFPAHAATFDELWRSRIKAESDPAERFGIEYKGETKVKKRDVEKKSYRKKRYHKRRWHRRHRR